MTICRVAGHETAIDDEEANEANARLIAAAPDLLAALVAIRNYARDSRTGRMMSGEGYAIAEKAIAKATGETS